MATRVVMPKLTDTMEEGVVLGWKKHEGDQVAAGDVLAEIETDKAVMDLEAFGSGTLRKVLAGEGQTVKSGALIAVIAEPDEDIHAVMDEGIAPAHTAAPEQKPKPSTQVKPEIQPQRGQPQTKDEKGKESKDTQEHEIKASPRAKALAKERGIDLRTMKGTGPDGRIIERDLPEATPSAPTAAAVATDRPLSQMRKAIARTMVQSKAPVPHFYLTAEIAMEEAERLRHQLKRLHQVHPSVTDLLIKAVALALMRHPEINVSFAGESLRQHGSIDIGIAVGLDDGLITPVLRNCGSKNLEHIAVESRQLIERARNKRLQPHEYAQATFSISNLGMFAIENFIAVLMPPEAAALAVGTIRDVPIIDNGAVKVGRRMKVTLSCDHRALDGMQAAEFLQEFKTILEAPLQLVVGDERR
ncbi:MAG: 2-oxo acid dehydrogenase subunit E2 [Nitrospirota bacterium]|nr:2-oxo acid dehydrogenase subunit E2 [Nitrospirota bacterium]